MADVWLECPACHFQTRLGPVFTGCEVCLRQDSAVPLEVRYGSVHPSNDGTEGSGLWRWRELLPPVAGNLTLGEGNTPLLPLSGNGGPALFFKNETQNPTWSWKDRPGCVSVAMAREFGFSRVAAISTGNLGNSVAAYATAAGLDCTIFCHPESPTLQVAQMMNYGAKVVRGGDQPALLRSLILEDGCFPCSSLYTQYGCSNPFGVEGLKTIAFEIYVQLGNQVPDLIFVPVGSGDGIYGIWKGFRELRDCGLAGKTPRMIACQASGADSLFRAFEKRGSHVNPLASVGTVALSVGELAAGDHALRAVYESEGTVMVSTDPETFDAMHVLMRHGYAVEPASAIAFSCAMKSAPAGPSGETWIVIGSGAAVKWPECLLRGFEMPPVLTAGSAGSVVPF